jgi:uncharacterized protein YodC (DUF2158 family)
MLNIKMKSNCVLVKSGMPLLLVSGYADYVNNVN